MLFLLIESDLEDPAIEKVARQCLSALRRMGYSFTDAYVDEPGCAACLHMSLMSAIQQAPPEFARSEHEEFPH